MTKEFDNESAGAGRSWVHKGKTQATTSVGTKNNGANRIRIATKFDCGQGMVFARNVSGATHAQKALAEIRDGPCCYQDCLSLDLLD